MELVHGHAGLVSTQAEDRAVRCYDAVSRQEVSKLRLQFIASCCLGGDVTFRAILPLGRGDHCIVGSGHVVVVMYWQPIHIVHYTILQVHNMSN